MSKHPLSYTLLEWLALSPEERHQAITEIAEQNPESIAAKSVGEAAERSSGRTPEQGMGGSGHPVSSEPPSGPSEAHPSPVIMERADSDQGPGSSTNEDTGLKSRKTPSRIGAPGQPVRPAPPSWRGHSDELVAKQVAAHRTIFYWSAATLRKRI